MNARVSGPLWAITAYFNPRGYRRRRENYHAFRRRLGVPLLTVELGYHGRFDLGQGDADVVIALDGSHVMWQKERLLNAGLTALPTGCETVAWLDCDVVFERPDWPEAAHEALNRHRVVHLFRSVHEPGPTDPPDAPGVSTGVSIMETMTGEGVPRDLLRGNMRADRNVHSGLAWAMRRNTLTGGLYDACILGSGNRAILAAQLGRYEDAIHYLRMGPRWRAHYLAWARPHFERVQGAVGAIDGRIVHLWHGSLQDRAYAERHVALRRFDFDPVADIRTTCSHVWEWSSKKTNMHSFVADYFRTRNEDGTGADPDGTDAADATDTESTRS